MSGLNTGEVRIAGTGAIWKAPLGTTTPADSTTAWGAAFKHLGYCTDGFTATPNFKTMFIHGWQRLAPIRQVTTEFDFKFGFELLQTNKDTLALAWGGGAVSLNPPTLGTVAIAATTGVLTVSAAETLAVNDPVQLGAITGTDGSFVAGVTYYVKTALTSTTLTVSAAVGGAAIVSASAGTAASIAKVTGAYSIAVPTDPSAPFVLGMDWSDGATSGRLVIPSAVLTQLPTVKSTRSDAIRYAFEVQALIPADGSAPVLPYGLDAAIGY
jgi:hypothetical protein